MAKGTKKFIKHNLPVGHYHIVESYALGDDGVCFCDNCNKYIKNIAVVENEDTKKRYNVGLDCAETLSGITEDDIEYYSRPFVRVKQLRAKINKALKKNGTLHVIRRPYNNDGEIYVEVWKGDVKRPEILGHFLLYENVQVEFLKKYMKDLYKIALHNPDFVRCEILPVEKSGDVSDGLTFEWGLKEYTSLGETRHYASATLSKNGETIITSDNGGRSEESCVSAMLDAYNTYLFESGLRKISENE